MLCAVTIRVFLRICDLDNNVNKHCVCYRERCLKFLNSLEDYERLKPEERLMLMQRNQDNAEMFAYIHVFNQQTWQEELETSDESDLVTPMPG